MGKIKKTIAVEEQVQQEVEQVQPEPTIFDKYRHYIKQANSDFIHGIKYQEIMEIHRYVEKVLNKQLPLDTSCGVCVIKRIKQFASLEKNV